MKIRKRRWRTLLRMFYGAHLHPAEVAQDEFPAGLGGIFMRGLRDLFGVTFVTSKFNFRARKEMRLGGRK